LIFIILGSIYKNGHFINFYSRTRSILTALKLMCSH